MFFFDVVEASGHWLVGGFVPSIDGFPAVVGSSDLGLVEVV